MKGYKMLSETMNSFVFDVKWLKKTNASKKGNDKLDDVIDIIFN